MLTMFKTPIAAFAMAIALISPAKAALVLDKTGPVSQIFQFDQGDGTFSVVLHNIYGPNSINPTFSTPPLFAGSPPQPTKPWTYNGPITQYTIKLTTPAPLE